MDSIMIYQEYTDFMFLRYIRNESINRFVLSDIGIEILVKSESEGQ